MFYFFFFFCICHCGIIVFIKRDFCQSFSIDACRVHVWINRVQLDISIESNLVSKSKREYITTEEKNNSAHGFIGVFVRNIFIRVLNLTADLSHIQTQHTNTNARVRNVPKRKSGKILACSYTLIQAKPKGKCCEMALISDAKCAPWWGIEKRQQRHSQYLLRSVWSLKRECG